MMEKSSAPRESTRPSQMDSAVISGMAGQSEAEKLASSIRIGSLSLKLEELRSQVVGAQLGEEAIHTSLIAGAIGLVIVILFMILGISPSGSGCRYCSSDVYRSDAGDI